ncbi:hypothetical protein OF122_11315 [Pelagibacterium flavum]|uniref:Uncharacterized protein n=1 Tax=Pelagibacterium flavum TaxID=2984530 RepID=A0ABY6IJB6_9HYPH|nr:hypothetical protein [Pelagibacterium sp. YIM 151497]UYQ70663.1 hypothetical protein OF122_11315 [Pelagibacterium sp. YIM 151497]
MEVKNLRPIRDAGTLVATFDLQATPEITLIDWQLRRTKSGLRAFPPSPRHGRASARVEPATFEQIARLAAAAYQEGSARNDYSS